jgi:predicted NUDIX family NTP pyrophosphohydrolase
MKKSAGILVYRNNSQPEFFLVHPGGPFWKNKHEGAWSIPKGEFSDEDALAAARREFEEETGQSIDGDFIALNPIKQKGGKLVYAFAVAGKVDESKIVSNTFKLEWPYKSGKWISVPEIDKAGWFDFDEAKKLINPSQSVLLDELLDRLKTGA